MSATPLLKTPLHALHLELGAKMVAFAGYDMPVAYPAGIIAEHRHSRSAAALFDVSHMGQAELHGDRAARALETLVPMDVVDLPLHKQRYAFFTNSAGGILDDLMIARREGRLFLVVNAACKEADFRHLNISIGDRCTVRPLPDQALLALQGPRAVNALARLAPGIGSLSFMTGNDVRLVDADCFVTRSGYTGEDGFEISVPASHAEQLARALLAHPDVKPAGLGARDTLRLEAGLCLYGHDINTTTTPIEAGLLWSIGKERRANGGFPGAAIIQKQIADGAPRKRVGLLPEGKAIAREGAEIVIGGKVVGTVTSGGFAPTLGRAIAMGYVERAHSANGTKVDLLVRGKPVPAEIVPMPFVKHAYYRG